VQCSSTRKALPDHYRVASSVVLAMWRYEVVVGVAPFKQACNHLLLCSMDFLQADKVRCKNVWFVLNPRYCFYSLEEFFEPGLNVFCAQDVLVNTFLLPLDAS
jgi:hypothetical protein